MRITRRHADEEGVQIANGGFIYRTNLIQILNSYYYREIAGNILKLRAIDKTKAAMTTISKPTTIRRIIMSVLVNVLSLGSTNDTPRKAIP